MSGYVWTMAPQHMDPQTVAADFKNLAGSNGGYGRFSKSSRYGDFAWHGAIRLLESEGWTVVHTDDGAILITAPRKAKL